MRPFRFQTGPVLRHMSFNRKTPMRLLSAIALVFLAVPALGAQVLKPGLQPGLTRSPDSARKISLDEALRMAQQNSPDAIAAEGTERTSKAARVSAVGAILPSATLSAGHVVQLGGGLTRLNQNGEEVGGPLALLPERCPGARPAAAEARRGMMQRAPRPPGARPWAPLPHAPERRTQSGAAPVAAPALPAKETLSYAIQWRLIDAGATMAPASVSLTPWR